MNDITYGHDPLVSFLLVFHATSALTTRAIAGSSRVTLTFNDYISDLPIQIQSPDTYFLFFSFLLSSTPLNMENYRIIKHKIPAAHLREFPQATLHSEEDILHLAVNQYIPLNNPHPRPGDVTIIAAHAVGYHKELYEPLWDELAAQARLHGWRIRSIWMADVAWHGESYRMNEELVGNSPGWYDHSRDLANLINLRREEMVRPIVGVGHSMGGNQMYVFFFFLVSFFAPFEKKRNGSFFPISLPPNPPKKELPMHISAKPKRKYQKTKLISSPFFSFFHLHPERNSPSTILPSSQPSSSWTQSFK